MTLVICAWCQKAGQPSFLREKEPFEDAQVSHGMCETHEQEWRDEAERLHAKREVSA